MGSFAGHIDGGIFYVGIGLWWMYKIFTHYISIQLSRKGTFRSQLSYKSQCMCCAVPIESIMKIAFPMAGFLAEVFNGGANFFDADGNFTKLVNMQHMTIYGLFVLHGLVDLAMALGVPLPAGLDYGTMALGLGWYGMSFYFHASMPGKEPMEGMIHILPIPVLWILAGCFLLDLRSRGTSLPLAITRIWAMLVLGSWFIHASFILYTPYPFPGNEPNPAWNGSDHTNVHAIVAIFGFHLCLHVVTIVLGYLLLYFLMKKRISEKTSLCRDECHKLLGEEAEQDTAA